MPPAGADNLTHGPGHRRVGSHPATSGRIRGRAQHAQPRRRKGTRTGDEGSRTLMKVSTRRDALFAQLQTVTRAASTRSAVQALSGVQIAASEGRIELRPTDMEIALRVPVDGDVVRDGAVVLPGRLLVDVVRALPGAEVSLELRASEQDVEIRSGSAMFHIGTLRLEAFPPLPEPEPSTRVEVPAAALVETIGKVALAASTDQARLVLSGILVSASFNELRMVATDSYRLAVKETRLERSLAGSFE